MNELNRDISESIPGQAGSLQVGFVLVHVENQAGP